MPKSHEDQTFLSIFCSSKNKKKEKKERKKKRRKCLVAVVVVAEMLPGAKKYFQPLAFNY